MPAETYGSGIVPQIGDTERMLLVKDVIAVGGITLTISGVTGVYRGNGAPGALVPSGSAAVYYSDDTGGIWSWNGSTWIEMIAPI